jgi:hypothetical protein
VTLLQADHPDLRTMPADHAMLGESAAATSGGRHTPLDLTEYLELAGLLEVPEYEVTTKFMGIVMCSRATIQRWTRH